MRGCGNHLANLEVRAHLGGILVLLVLLDVIARCFCSLSDADEAKDTTKIFGNTAGTKMPDTQNKSRGSQEKSHECPKASFFDMESRISELDGSLFLKMEYYLEDPSNTCLTSISTCMRNSFARTLLHMDTYNAASIHWYHTCIIHRAVTNLMCFTSYS